MELRAEIEIAAPLARVWQAVTDFAAYPRYNPLLTELSGPLRVGARLRGVMSYADGAERRFRAELCVLHPPRELRWRWSWLLSRLLCVEHYFVLKDTDASGTRLVQGLHVEGWLERSMGTELTQMARGLVGMNEALQRRLMHSDRTPG